MTDFGALEARMRDRLAQAGIAETVGIPVASSRIPAPLSSAQSRMFHHWLRYPSSAAYNVCIVMRFDASVEVKALAAAFGILVDRHEVLRTRYSMDADGVPQQNVMEPYDPVCRDRKSVV